VRPGFVVVAVPLGDQFSDVRQVREVVIIQALVTEFAVEALDVDVLGRFARGDELQIDSLAVGPAVHVAAHEFRSLVGADRPWHPAELTHSVEYVGDLLT